ncbi:MAG: hypothetical protein ABIG90_01660 [bacterium]
MILLVWIASVIAAYFGWISWEGAIKAGLIGSVVAFLWPHFAPHLGGIGTAAGGAAGAAGGVVGGIGGLFQKILGFILAPLLGLVVVLIADGLAPGLIGGIWFYTSLFLAFLVALILSFLLGGGKGIKIWAGLLVVVSLASLVWVIFTDYLNDVKKVEVRIRNGRQTILPAHRRPFVKAGDRVWIEATGDYTVELANGNLAEIPAAGLYDYLINDRPLGHISMSVQGWSELENIEVEGGGEKAVVRGNIPAGVAKTELIFVFNLPAVYDATGNLVQVQPRDGFFRVRVAINKETGAKLGQGLDKLYGLSPRVWLWGVGLTLLITIGLAACFKKPLIVLFVVGVLVLFAIDAGISKGGFAKIQQATGTGARTSRGAFEKSIVLKGPNTPSETIDLGYFPSYDINISGPLGTKIIFNDGTKGLVTESFGMKTGPICFLGEAGKTVRLVFSPRR